MNQRGFSIVFLGVIIAALIIGTGGYLFITKQKTQLLNEVPDGTSQLKEIVGSGTPYISKPRLCGEEELLDERLTNHQIIWHLDITPQVISATKQVEVTFKAEVGDSPALILESVELVRFNKNMEVEKSYGKMQDNGPDTIDLSKKVRIFILKIDLNEPLPDSADPWQNLVRFGVAAEYEGLPCKSFYGLGIHGGGTGANYLRVVPASISPEEMFAQLADELERRDFEAAQKHFTDKPKNQKVEIFFEQMNDAEITDLANEFRNAKLKTNYDDELRFYEVIFTDENGVRRPWEIQLQRSINGKWVIDD